MIVRSHDGTLIYGESHIIPRAKGDLLVVHGLGEHSGRYGEFTQKLNKLGYSVHLLDMRGHGKSKGTRGHFTSIEELHKDVDAWLEHLVAERTIGNRPFYLVGHSLGGLVALTYSAAYVARPPKPTLAGVVLSAPAVGIKWSPRKVLESQLAHKVPRFLQNIQVPTGLPYEFLTHDSVEKQNFESDPLVHQWITPAGYLAVEKAMNQLPKLVAKIHFPCLFLVSGRDHVVDTNATMRLVKKLMVAHPGQMDVRLFHTFYHEPFHEKKRERAYLELKKWLLKQRQSKPVSSKSFATEAIAREISR